MIKTGVVKENETPSVLSGIKSAKIQDGEPLAEGEELDKTFESLASILDEDPKADVKKQRK